MYRYGLILFVLQCGIHGRVSVSVVAVNYALSMVHVFNLKEIIALSFRICRIKVFFSFPCSAQMTSGTTFELKKYGVSCILSV